MSGQDRNLRDPDFIENAEIETRDFQICAFCRTFKKMSSRHRRIFFKFLYFFDLLGCFLPANTTKKIVEL